MPFGKKKSNRVEGFISLVAQNETIKILTQNDEVSLQLLDDGGDDDVVIKPVFKSYIAPHIKHFFTFQNKKENCDEIFFSISVEKNLKYVN